jgi:hypothetical protein
VKVVKPGLTDGVNDGVEHGGLLGGLWDVNSRMPLRPGGTYRAIA